MKELRFNKTWTFVFLILPLEPKVPAASSPDHHWRMHSSLRRFVAPWALCRVLRWEKKKSQSLSKLFFFFLTCCLRVCGPSSPPSSQTLPENLGQVLFSFSLQHKPWVWRGSWEMERHPTVLFKAGVSNSRCNATCCDPYKIHSSQTSS